jgi:hypothetical protein
LVAYKVRVLDANNAGSDIVEFPLDEEADDPQQDEVDPVREELLEVDHEHLPVVIGKGC